MGCTEDGLLNSDHYWISTYQKQSARLQSLFLIFQLYFCRHQASIGKSQLSQPQSLSQSLLYHFSCLRTSCRSHLERLRLMFVLVQSLHFLITCASTHAYQFCFLNAFQSHSSRHAQISLCQIHSSTPLLSQFLSMIGDAFASVVYQSCLFWLELFHFVIFELSVTFYQIFLLLLGFGTSPKFLYLSVKVTFLYHLLFHPHHLRIHQSLVQKSHSRFIQMQEKMRCHHSHHLVLIITMLDSRAIVLSQPSQDHFVRY